jgi:hypothetical protein
MRAWKHLVLALAGVLGLVGVLAVGQSLSIYYRSSQFDDYLKHEVWWTRVTQHLKVSLLDKAKIYSLPVNEDDIRITADGAVFRVDIAYQVPINLIVFEHPLKFHSIGAGLLRD